MSRCLASLHGVLADARSPASPVLSRHSDFLTIFPPRFVSFARRYHGSTHGFAPSTPRAAPSGLELVARFPAGLPSAKSSGSLKFLGNPNDRSLVFLDPGRPICSRPYGTVARPPSTKTGRRRRSAEFRGSIARLSVSLPTFHGMDRSHLAQDSLPGAGQALLDGLLPARFLQKVSNSLHARCPPSPSFLTQSAPLRETNTPVCFQSKSSMRL